MGTSVFSLSACGLLLVQAGQGDMGNLDGGSGVVRDVFHATCCTYLDDNGLDFRSEVREFRHLTDRTAIANDVWKWALMDGAFAQTKGISLTGGYICAAMALELPGGWSRCLFQKGAGLCGRGRLSEDRASVGGAILPRS